MIVSLNEVESLVLKAVWGAGLTWGLAEEAAASAVWLARADLLLIGPLLARLEATGTSLPVDVGETIQPAAAGTALCPLLTGAWIADQGSANRRLDVRDVLAPLWLSAVVARSLPHECQLIAEWQDARLVLGRSGPLEPAKPRQSSMPAEAAGAMVLTLRQCAQSPRALQPRSSGGFMVSDADWQALQAFERRTYVPASERSRLAGAGAGLLDGD